MSSFMDVGVAYWERRGMASEFKTRLYVANDLAFGVGVALAGDQAHFLRNVLRLKPGDRVALFNGRDGEWAGEITEVGKRLARLTVGDQTRPQAGEADIWLAFAPIKRARIDFIAQKATELGATVLWPVFTRFTAMERVNLDRLRANAIEAAEQCGRLTVPEIREPIRFDQLLDAWPADRRLICCDETGAGAPIVEAIAASKASVAGLLIGPEGGLSKEELDRLDKTPNVCRVSLGSRILRADTAALAALACWQAVAGDWRPGWPDGNQ
jgi:16S rRNA (uracil1498-N3)-methyltransferase